MVNNLITRSTATASVAGDGEIVLTQFPRTQTIN